MQKTNYKLLEHFQNPRNVGIIENADGYARGKNPVNDYLTDIYIKVENGCIKDVKFKTVGCVVTIASVSALSEVVKGKSLDEILGNKNPFEMLMKLIEQEIGKVPEKNWHCPPTAIQTLLKAIADYYRKNKENEKLKIIEKIIFDIESYFEAKLNQ
jgi:nitrogen fixation NifU-like protein